MTAVNPHRREPEGGRRLVIVEQALGDVYEAVAIHPEAVEFLEQPVEVTTMRLVRADVFRSHDRIEVDAQSASAGRE